MDKKNTPEVKLGQYKGLAVTRHVRPVTDKTVDIELVHQTRMHAVYHPTTEPAKRGFRALLDFAGYMDGKEIPDSRMEKVMVVLGDGKLMPAAEQAIYGHRAGEVFRFDFTYPQDFRLPELSGKTAQFEIELRSLAEKVTPAPDEAFAKSLGFDSLDALKADLRAKKQKIHEEGADRAAGKQLLDMAGANMTVDLPAEILDRTAQNEMKLLKERLSRSGITLEQHCKNSRTTPEALEKDYRAQAESRIRFVSISLDKNPKRVTKFVKKTKLPETFTSWHDPDLVIPATLPADVLPGFFVLDGHGHLVGFVRGFVDWADPAVPAYFEKLADKYAVRK